MKKFKPLRKRKVKNYVKIGIALFGILFILTNCEKDTQIDNAIFENSLSQQKPNVKTVTYNKSNGKFNSIVNELGINEFLDINNQSDNSLSKSTKIKGILVKTDVIKEISIGNYISYTMLVDTKKSSKNKFYNLTIENINGVSKMFITKYKPSKDWIDDSNQPFEGSITTYRTADLTDVTDDTDGIDEGNLDGVGGGDGVDNTTYPDDCDGAVFQTTVLVSYPCGCGHWPEDDCKGCQSKQPRYPGYNLVTTYECVGGTDDTWEPPVDDSENDTSGGGGVSTPDSNSVSYTVLVSIDGTPVESTATMKADMINGILGFSLTTSEFNWLIAHEKEEDLILAFLENNSSSSNIDFTNRAIKALSNSSYLSFVDILYNRTNLDLNSAIDPNNNTIGGYDTTPITAYNPNQDSWPFIGNVIPITDFVGWGESGLERDCMTYAKEQLRKAGYQISNYGDAGQTYQVYTEQNGINLDNTGKGVAYLISALHRGIPVIVGVNYEPGSVYNKNTDNSTDHFVVIVGMGTDSNGKNYFNFFDNASFWKPYYNWGASLDNKFYFDSATGSLIGSSRTNFCDNVGGVYQVTQIRKSKPL